MYWDPQQAIANSAWTIKQKSLLFMISLWQTANQISNLIKITENKN